MEVPKPCYHCGEQHTEPGVYGFQPCSKCETDNHSKLAPCKRCVFLFEENERANNPFNIRIKKPKTDPLKAA